MKQEKTQTLKKLLLNKSSKYEILIELAEKENCHSTLYKKIKKQSTQTALDMKILVKIGAITLIQTAKHMRGSRIPKFYIGSSKHGQYERTKRNTKYYSLTDNGRRILENLNMIFGEIL